MPLAVFSRRTFRQPGDPPMSIKCNKPLSAAMLHIALLFTVGAACLIPGASSTAYAPQAAGAIACTATDQSGPPIRSAVVTVRALDRSTTWTAKTSSAGLYEFPQIPVGNVEIKAEAPGFATTRPNGFTLTVNQVARVA